MTDQDEKYDILVNKLRNTTPVARDEEALTHSIMEAIAREKPVIRNPVVVWLRPVMTVAALFLLGLFLYQLNDGENSTRVNDPAKLLTFKLIKKEYCNTDTNLMVNEKRNLLSQYFCYMKNNRIENDESKEYYLKQFSKIQKRDYR
jgi:hypothetical protein